MQGSGGNRQSALALRRAVGFLILSGFVGLARGGETAGRPAPAELDEEPPGPRKAEVPEAAADEPGKPIDWLSGGVGYDLVSDYVWRGIVLSDYAGEGREKPNHQLTVRASVDTEPLLGADLGSINASIWWEWYADQDVLNRLAGDADTSEHNQEIDYTLSWSCAFEDLPVSSIEIGWINYKFPALHGDARNTQEVFAAVGLNDEPLWAALGLAGFTLNPYAAYYLDVDDVQGGWIEFGLSHDVALAELGLDRTPILRHVTLTPSVTFGIDHRYMDRFFATGDRSTKFSNITYGLALGYDLSDALDMPPALGSVTLAGHLNYSQNLRDDLRGTGYFDQWYGGLSLAWEW